MTVSRGIYSKRVNGTLSERLFAKTRRAENGCLEFTGCLTESGYGLLSGHVKAHRAAWEIANGPIPDSIDVCHKCDNRKCVDVEHLFLGDREANMQDAAAKGRVRSGDGHEWSRLTDEQAEEVRRLCGTMRQKDVAAMFGVTQSNVSRIVNHRSRRRHAAAQAD